MSALEMPNETVVFIGAIVGSAARTLFPFWEKARENPDIIFERKFLGTAIISFVSAVALGIGAFPTLLQTVEGMNLSPGVIFAIVATAAFGINSGANMLLSHKTTAETKTGPT
jgi:hypothetical protein